MKSHTKATTKKFPKAILIGGAIVLLAAVYALTAHAIKLWPFNTSTTGTSQTTSAPTTQTQPTTTTDSTSSNTPAPSTTNTAKTSDTTTTTPQPSTGGILITSASQGTVQNNDSDTLHIRAQIDGTENSGTCTLTLTKGSATPITLTSGIQAQSKVSTCQGFDISISGQGMSKGTWNIALGYTSGSLKGSTTGQVVIQ